MYLKFQIKLGYRYFDQNTIKDVLKIEGVEGEFFVNIKTRSVVSYEGFKYEGKTYYTLDQLPDGLYNVEYEESTATPIFDANVEEISENKWKISITNIQYEGYIHKWDVKYQLEGKNYKSEDLSFVVTQQGDYTISISNGNVQSESIVVTILKTVEIAKEMNKVFDNNKQLIDAYGNQLTIPKGFKIAEDSATDVTGGIVIEDATYTNTMGSQFVWIPVGTVYTNAEKTESKTITLNRYTFATDGTPTGQGTNVISPHFQELATSSYGNAVAKNLQGFIDSSNKNNGYYIGRYEAGVSGYDSNSIVKSNSNSEISWTGYTGDNIQLVCKTGQQVWNYVTQNKASELSRNMYTDTTFTSDLINSYAWDTAIVFIQEFSGDTDYSMQISLQSILVNTGEATDGTNNDVRCNVYDMAGNVWELTTETYKNSGFPCVDRGGSYNDSSHYTSLRGGNTAPGTSENGSFRPILYL